MVAMLLSLQIRTILHKIHARPASDIEKEAHEGGHLDEALAEVQHGGKDTDRVVAARKRFAVLGARKSKLYSNVELVSDKGVVCVRAHKQRRSFIPSHTSHVFLLAGVGTCVHFQGNLVP